MPPRQKKSAEEQRPFGASKEIHAIWWQAVDMLRGSMDAARHTEFVLELLFLKYLSDAFGERRTALAERLAADGMDEDLIGDFLEDHGAYTGTGVFWVPENARWSWITANVRSRAAGELLDEAIDALVREDPSLTGVLPKIFNRGDVDQRRLVELVHLINDASFSGGHRPTQDVLGEVYEHFLDNFSRAEGKRGGEFYTPPSLSRLIVEILEPYSGRLYDPACGSGGMFIEAARFSEAHRGRAHSGELAVYGQELNERTWRLAKMNLAIHGIDGNLAARWGDTFADDKHPDLRADFVMASPPFNIADWARDERDARWMYGVPPKNNANYAWLQHVVSKLGERGTAGIVLANGSTSSRSRGEGEIRQRMVEADLVACMIALPSLLFHTTQIPASLWFLAKDKSTQGGKGLTDRRGQILFVDAREMGEMAHRTERVLTDADLAKIADVYHVWRGTESTKAAGLTYEDVPGFCFSAGLETVREHGYALTPGRYVGSVPRSTPEQPIDLRDRPATLMRDLYAIFD